MHRREMLYNMSAWRVGDHRDASGKYGRLVEIWRFPPWRWSQKARVALLILSWVGCDAASMLSYYGELFC